MHEMTGIKYTDKGQGQAVVLIHGFCESKEMWRAFEKELSLYYRVLCPDLPGFGESPIATGHMDMEAAAASLLDWLDEVEAKDPIVIGHSLGGYVTLALAELAGPQLKAIGLFHSTAFADNEEKKGVRDRTVIFVEKNGVEAFVRSFVPPLFPEHRREELKEHIQTLVLQGLKTSKNGLIAFTGAMRDRKNRMDVLKDFQGRKLMICGELDPAVKIEDSRKHQGMVDDYHELKDTGHMGMFEREKETLGILKDFLEKAWLG